MTLAQVDTDVIEAAASHSWEAALLAGLVLGGFGFLGWMLKKGDGGFPDTRGANGRAY